MDDAFDRATLDFYDAEAPVYIASGRDGASRWLHAFMATLPGGARVLDLGCGGGRDSAALIARGFDVCPTDGSSSVAAKAEERLNRPVRIERFDELSDVGAFDAVWANASLLHVPLERLSDVLALVHRALRPNGLHFASYKSDCGAGRDRAGRYFNHPDRATLIAAYARSGPWDIVSVVDFFGGGYDAGQGPWIAITARRLTA